MIPVKRNHFYTKEIVSNAVGVRPQFKDLTGGSTESTLVFKGVFLKSSCKHPLMVILN